jgi:hypothetical protein
MHSGGLGVVAASCYASWHDPLRPTAGNAWHTCKECLRLFQAPTSWLIAEVRSTNVTRADTACTG